MSTGRKSSLTPNQTMGKLSEIEMLKLRMLARVYARPINDLDENDLLQETLVKIIAGDRKCPNDLSDNVLVFIKGVMKSLAHNHIKKKKRRMKLETGGEDYENSLETVADCNQMSPEDVLIEEEKFKEFMTFLKNECKGDKKVLLVMQGKLKFLQGEELCKFADVNKQELATILKRINRIINKYPPY